MVLPISLPVVARLLRSGFNATAENSAEAAQGLNSLERSDYVVVTGTVTDSDRVAALISAASSLKSTQEHGPTHFHRACNATIRSLNKLVSGYLYCARCAV